MAFYRFVSETYGIYEAVQKACSSSDPRRKSKPDGSWLQKVGEKYPGALSFWTEEGVCKYITSGLYHWHASILDQNVVIYRVSEKPGAILYEDPYQIILPYEPVLECISEKGLCRELNITINQV